MTIFGALDLGLQCRLSNLRKGNIPSRCVLHIPVEFKERPCHPVEFQSQGPHIYS